MLADNGWGYFFEIEFLLFSMCDAFICFNTSDTLDDRISVTFVLARCDVCDKQILYECRGINRFDKYRNEFDIGKF